MIPPHAVELRNQNNRASDGVFSSLHAGDEHAERRRVQDRRKAFERQELREMRQARKILLWEAMRWAVLLAVPSALLGWGIGYILGQASERVSPGWVAPQALVSLVLGAVCGALGGAAAKVLYDLFEEDRDMPVVVIGVATFVVLGAGISGAGQGSIFNTMVGIAGGIPVGLVSGLVVYILYSGLRATYSWARNELNGF